MSVEPGLDLITAMLAVLAAGATYVPVDPATPAARRHEILTQAGVALIVCDGPRAALIRGTEGALPCLDPSAAGPARPLPGIDAAAAAYVLFTSGSTGRPKGVEVTHEGLLNYVLFARDRYAPEPGEPTVVHTSAAFDLTLTSIFPPLTTGGRLHLIEGGLNVDALERELDRLGRVGLLKLTPAHLAALRDFKPERDWHARLLVVGGESLHASMLVPWSDSAVVNEYGPTETVVGCCVHEADARDTDEIPIGRPIANTRLPVLDERMEPVPAGTMGELYIGGAGVARGYVDAPGLTADRFVPDPFHPGKRLYRTGDFARWRPDGVLEFHGRGDRQVSVNGFRIELGEIDAAVGRQPAVRQAATVHTPDNRLVCFAAADAGALDPLELAARLRLQLPAYMIPHEVRVLSTLPLTPNAKVDHAALLAAALDGPPAVAGPGGSADAMTGYVAEIWRQVLGLAAVGDDDDWFALGGTSLSAAQLAGRLGGGLSLRSVFDAGTPRALARKLRESRADAQPGSAAGITPVDRSEPTHPASFGQERLWFLQQLDPASAVYSTVETLLIHGPLNLSAFERAVAAVVARHEILRTTLEEADGAVRQRIAPRVHIPVELVPAGDEEEAARLIEAFAAQPFDLARGPLLRVRLVRLDPGRHVLALVLHHAVTDAWSTRILQDELAAAYREAAEDRTWNGPPLPVQYADYAAWQRSMLSGELLRPHLDYWRARLDASDRPVDWGADRSRPELASFRGARCAARIDPLLTSRLRESGEGPGATLFMVLLTGFAALMHRRSGQQDIQVAVPVANRPRPELEGLVGFFVNTLVLRSELDGACTLRSLSERIRESCLDAYAHAEVPFERLVEELRPVRDLSANPLAQVMFTLQPPARRVPPVGPLVFEPWHAAPPTAKFDLLLAATEDEDGVELFLEYNTDLFEPATAERILTEYLAVLETLAGAPETAVAQIALPTRDQEARRGHDRWSAPAASGAGLGVLERFDAVVRTHPDLPAVVDVQGSTTYALLDERSRRLAGRLAASGVRRGDHVAVYLERGVEYVVAMLGAMRAGAVFVPFEAPLHEHRLAQVGDRIRALIADLERPGLVPPEVPVLSPDGADPASGRFADPGAAPVDAAYVIYTSGSTGVPKGVVVGHAQLANYVAAIIQTFPTEPGSGFAVLTTPAADLGYTALFGALCTAGTLHIVPAHRSLDARWLAEHFRTHRLDVLKTVPSQLAALSNDPEFGDLLPHEWLLLGGEPLAWTLVDRIERAKPGLKIVNHYGPTETTVGVLYHRVGDAPGERAQREVPLSRALPGCEAVIVDRAGAPVPPGIPGEVRIGGAGVAFGYLDASGRTAAAFTPDPAGTGTGAGAGSRLYRTGDLARYTEDGSIRLAGRRDRQLKIRGYRVEPGEVEAALLEHPAVTAVASLPEQDALGENRLVLFAAVPPAHAPTHQGRKRYRLPNGLAVLQLNRNETDYIYREIFELQAYLRHGIEIRPGDRIVDVGANIGLFSLFAHLSAPGVRITAIEPNPDAVAVAQANLRIHGADAELLPYGLAATESTAEFTAFDGFSLLSGFHPDATVEAETVTAFLRNQSALAGPDAAAADTLAEAAPGILAERFASRTFRVRSRPLSDVIVELGIDRVDLLKINAEKGELEVLRGLRAEHWALIGQAVVEMDVDEHVDEIVGLFARHGFETVVDQDELLAGTALRYLYATRRGGARTLKREAGAPGPTPQAAHPPLAEGELLEHLRNRLPEYLVPAAVEILEALPVTPNGKLDRAALAEARARRAGEADAGEPPAGRSERLVADVWKRVLNLPEVGRDENFFDRGGTSLLLVRVREGLAEDTGRVLDIVDLFRHPTVRRLAEHLDGLASDGASPGKSRLQRAGRRAAARLAALDDQDKE